MAAHLKKGFETCAVWLFDLRDLAMLTLLSCSGPAVAFIIAFGLVKGLPKEIDQETKSWPKHMSSHCTGCAWNQQKNDTVSTRELELEVIWGYSPGYCSAWNVLQLVCVCVLLHGAVTCFICLIGTHVTGSKTTENAKEEAQQKLLLYGCRYVKLCVQYR